MLRLGKKDLQIIFAEQKINTLIISSKKNQLFSKAEFLAESLERVSCRASCS